ncbi:hypothetical protein ACFQJC_03140 [Haloferax namakaokahaiae]|uniref:Uncharacterized protein n=1 Tax=Haloferax namakaokahaiae TaxID=1748331 RepID=A0ABD5ZB39_9EURY
MTHTNYLGLPDPLDPAPHGLGTLANTVVLTVAAVVGIVAAAVAATLVAPLAPGLGLLAVFAGWPVGFVVAVVALRAGLLAIVRTGVPADARTLLRRVRGGPTGDALPDATPRRMTDGGRPDDTEDDR